MNQEQIEALAAVADKARTLLADIKARYPGEALRCPHLQGLDQAVSRLETCWGTEGHERGIEAAASIMWEQLRSRQAPSTMVSWQDIRKDWIGDGCREEWRRKAASIISAYLAATGGEND